MKLTAIPDPLQGEKLAFVVPTPRPFVPDAGRLARLNHFPGRHLTGEALEGEHQFRVRRLGLRGQAVSPGVVSGLEIGLNRANGDSFFTLGAGSGLTVSGEDVVLDRKLIVRVGELTILDSVTGDLGPRVGELAAPAPQPQVGVLVWQPVSVPDDDLPLAIIPPGFDQNFTPCDRVPADESFYRRTRTDAARLVLCPWPETWRPLPAFGDDWRNRLAWEIFRAERAGFPPPPWLNVGLPVALVGFDENYQPLFADRDAVVRRGGRPRTRVLRERVGEPRLWQAQMNQFITQLAELGDAGAGPVYFRYLPPVGLLPKAFLELTKFPGAGDTPPRWNITQTFFPDSYLVQVSVASLEQLDAVFDEARSLDGYDVGVPDAVELLLAVSQKFFDPQLLELDQIAPEFLQTVGALNDARANWLARRADLQAKDSALAMALTSNALVFPDRDPEQLDPEESIASEVPAPGEESYGTENDDGALAGTEFVALRNLQGDYLKKFSPAEIAQLSDPGLQAYLTKQNNIQSEEGQALDARGLRDFIAYLEAKADRADGLVDRGFLKVNPHVFRLGQLLGNNALTSRFAASASLASTVTRSPDATPASGVNTFARQLFANMQPSAAADASAAPATALRAAPATRGGALATSFATSLVGSRPFSTTVHNLVLSGEVLSTQTGAGQVTTLQNLVHQSNNPEAIAALKNLMDVSSATVEAQGQLKNLATFADNFVPNFDNISPNQIRAIPLDRLQPALAPEVRKDISSAKLEIFDQLLQLDISLAGLTTDFVDTLPGATAPTVFNFHQLLAQRVDPLLNLTNADEAAHFSVGVKHADMSIAALRAVESRIKLYRNFITVCRDKLAKIEASQAALEQRLKVVGDELKEARQDVAVAQALLAEETARVQGINDHREQILREHASFVVFHRPRAVEARDNSPSRALEPALRIAPVPACLEANLPLPPDLHALAEAFRDAPARWFKYAPQWIEGLDRIEPLRDLMIRAAKQTATITRAAPVASSGRFASAITGVFAARSAVFASQISLVSALNPALFPSWSWGELRRRAHETLTLGHLIDAGPTKLAQQAAGELHNLFQVGACLHHSFSQVTPFLRLLWAEQFSEFDGPADFRNLSRLPRWTEVPFTFRREMQLDADWLYSRVDATQPAALDLIHDLIRVGLLLASHAPVDQLITGLIAEETTPVKGGLIKVLVDPLRIRIGMEVVVHQANVALARAVVEDIGAGQVSARITSVPVAAKLNPGLTSVRFQEAVSLSMR